MKSAPKLVLVSQDEGLIAHWQRALGRKSLVVESTFSDYSSAERMHGTAAWIDLSGPNIPAWNDATWHSVCKIGGGRIIAASSNPNDKDAIEALDAGCVAYCHAFSDGSTLKQVQQVVDAGHVWIGKTLMQRLLQNVNQVVSSKREPDSSWSGELTKREREIATLAANGASNNAISIDCNISERTVKAHLSAVFSKLNITDRLQLALRVHGIN